MLRAFFSFIWYNLTFFFNRTNKKIKKIFYFFILSIGPIWLIKVFICSYLLKTIPLFDIYEISAIILSLCLLIFLYKKIRLKKKNKKLYLNYLNFLIFKKNIYNLLNLNFVYVYVKYITYGYLNFIKRMFNNILYILKQKLILNDKNFSFFSKKKEIK